MSRNRFKRTKRVRPVNQPPGRLDLPPDVAAFVRVFDEAGWGCTVDASEGGMVWTIRHLNGDPAMVFRSGSAVDADRPPNSGSLCADLMGVWHEPEFQRQYESGLVDIYGRPLHPEGRDFFAEYHSGHKH